MITVVVRGLDRLPAALKKEREREGKAMNKAIRRAGFDRMKELKAALRRGKGIFAPLSYISRAISSKTEGRLSANRPLAKMAVAVGYYDPKKDPIEMTFGFTGPKLSKSWKRIALFQQSGGTRPISDQFRESLIHRASLLPERSKARRYLLIKKSTRQFETPPRPIIEPFWQSTKAKTKREVIENFRRLLRGEKI